MKTLIDFKTKHRTAKEVIMDTDSKRKLNVYIVAICCLALIAGFILIGSITAFSANGLPAPNLPHVKRAGDTSLQVSWTKVKGASGYEIYRYDSSKKKYVKAKTISKVSTVKWKNTKLKTGKKYSYKVRAWQRINGFKKYGDFSYVVSAVPYKKSAKVVNAGIRFNGDSTMTIGLMQKLKLPATVTPATYGTAKKKTVVDKNVRVVLTNQPFLGQTDSKTIVGKQVGKANVYALAHNGNMKKISVNVVDYAKPKSWDWDKIKYVDPDVHNLFTTYHDDFTDIVSWLAQHNSIEGDIYMEKSGGIVNKSNISIIGIDDKIQRILNLFPPGDMKFRVKDIGVSTEIYLVPSGERHWIFYFIQEELIDNPDDDIYGGIKIANHWEFQLFIPE